MKTLSLTNLDRITELDFDRSSSTNSVGGRLSIAKFNNLKKLRAAKNNLSRFSLATTGNLNSTLEELSLPDNSLNVISSISNLSNLKDLDLSNNGLSKSNIDSILQSLDINGQTNGTVQLGGTNSLPTLGNYNTNKLSLESKGWTVGIAGGIDTNFSAAEGYQPDSSTTNTSDHPDWEGRPRNHTADGNWKNDPANNRIFTTGTFRNIRTKNPIRAKVGDTITATAIFDYGDTTLQNDDERTFALALTDMPAYPAQLSGSENENIQAYPHILVFTKFVSSKIRLLYKGSVRGSFNALNLSAATGDKFDLTFNVTLGTTKDNSTITVSLLNITDNTTVGATTITGIDQNIYDSLVSSTSNVKLNIQAGELEDTSIGRINVYKAIGRVTSEYDFNINWDLTNVPVTSFDPDGNVNDRPRINTFREDGNYIQYLNAGGIYVDPSGTPFSPSTPPWGDRSVASTSISIPSYNTIGQSLNAGVDVFVANSMGVEFQPPVSNWTATSAQAGETQYQLLFTEPGTRNIRVKITP